MHDEDPDYVMSPDPEREAWLHIAAWDGLKTADLDPLAALLRSEFEIEATLREAIADAIEGKSPSCQMEAKRTRRGNPGDEDATRKRHGRIAAFVRERANGKGEFEAAIAEAMNHFKLGRTTVTSALQKDDAYRETLAPKLRTFWDQVCRANRD